MISETFHCKLCGKKMKAKGNFNIDVLFYFSLLKSHLYFFFHCLKNHYKEIPNKKRFFLLAIKHFLIDLIKVIVFSILFLIRVLLFPLYAFLKYWIYFDD